jgi:site-specific DNA-cytosine methylase
MLFVCAYRLILVAFHVEATGLSVAGAFSMPTAMKRPGAAIVVPRNSVKSVATTRIVSAAIPKAPAKRLSVAMPVTEAPAKKPAAGSTMLRTSSMKTSAGAKMKSQSSFVDIEICHKLHNGFSDAEKLRISDTCKMLGKIPISSACTGSNASAVAVANVLQVVGAGELEEDFIAELEGSKRKFAEFISARLQGNLRHSFDCITKACMQRAQCLIHEGECIVPDSSLICFIGWSCKNFSKEFSVNTDGLKRDDFISRGFAAGEGSSGQTFWAMIKIMTSKTHIYIVWENVPEVMTDDATWSIIVEAVEGAGYAIAASLFNSMDFYLPQDRKRVYAICVWAAPFGGMDAARAHSEVLLQQVQKLGAPGKAYALDKFLLAPTSASSLRHCGKEKGIADEEVDPLWKKRQTEFCLDKGLRISSIAVPSELESCPWVKALPLRERNGLAIHLELQPDITSIDLNPTLPRMSIVTAKGFVSTVLPGGKVFMPKRKQQLVGVDMMRLQDSPPSDYIIIYMYIHIYI